MSSDINSTSRSNLGATRFVASSALDALGLRPENGR